MAVIDSKASQITKIITEKANIVIDCDTSISAGNPIGYLGIYQVPKPKRVVPYKISDSSPDVSTNLDKILNPIFKSEQKVIMEVSEKS